MIKVLVVLLALVAGCSPWSSKDTATAGKVFRCVQSCASACMREFQEQATCPAAPAGNVVQP